MKLLLQNGTVVNGQESGRKDILIDGETICRVGKDIPPGEADETVDLEGKLVFPGFIDAHTHFDLEVSGTVTADDFARIKGRPCKKPLKTGTERRMENLPVITVSTWPFPTGTKRLLPRSRI